MITKLDKKFNGVIFKIKDGTIVPDDQYVVFLAKDDAVPAMLQTYWEECKRLKADPRQIQAVEDLIAAVLSWRAEHPHLCKTPDISKDEILLW